MYLPHSPMTNSGQRRGTASNPQIVPCDLEDGGGYSGDGGSRFGIGGMVRNSFCKEEVRCRGLPSHLGFSGASSLSVTAAAAALSVADADGSGGGSGNSSSGTGESFRVEEAGGRGLPSELGLGGTTTSSRTVVGAAAALAVTGGGHPELGHVELFQSARAKDCPWGNDTCSSAASTAGSRRLSISSYNNYQGGHVATKKSQCVDNTSRRTNPIAATSLANGGGEETGLEGGKEVDFRFHDIHFSVEVSTCKTKAALMGEKAGVKEILKGVSGAVGSGQILAIVGASGAGKTSLLDVLVGKIKNGTKGLSLTGDITVNGENMSRAFFLENAAYVPQEDRLWSALTVRENLLFACKMYGPDMSQAQCERRVDEVVSSLGLESCDDTKVGNVFLKGISGGQKRRTSIGMELVVRRKIIFLDEPTSGLDAASASEVMALLRRLASETDMIIITSVHQPSTRVFNSFDQVILLTMGQTAYFGPAVGSLEHFARLGHTPVGLVNPADYLLEITNSDFNDAKVVQQLADAWFHSAACETLNQRLGSAYPAPVVPGRKPGFLSYFRQFRALVARATLNSIRDPATYALRLVLYLCFSFFLGSVYYQVENTQSDILDRVFLIILINTFNSFMNMAAIPVFTLEKEAVVKEVQNGQYGAANFCIANTVVQIPFVFLIALCCATPVYFITDMNDDAVRYFQFTVAMFLMLLVIESLTQIVGVLVKNVVLGIAVFASANSMFFIFNGVFIVPDNIPDFWIWIYWISPLRYSWEIMAKIVFDGQTYSGFDDCVTCYGETGDQVLDSLSVGGGTNLNDVSLLENCGILVALTVFCRLVLYVVLKRSLF